ncbi:hypothetical protein KQX54_016014 [Cotesia glomerata]|uniref:Uncharacterized protein n=1 Tax=Cotesia glomerata TaxID=32391 RepID=A0AAV7IDZ4_COTGL|nr:hypothetical protein KQX54_016014 [Cotesia glomerata]
MYRKNEKVEPILFKEAKPGHPVGEIIKRIFRWYVNCEKGGYIKARVGLDTEVEDVRGSRDVSGKREEVGKGRDQREGEFRNAMSGLVRPAEIRVLIWRVSSPLYNLLCYTASPPSLARCRLVVVVRHEKRRRNRVTTSLKPNKSKKTIRYLLRVNKLHSTLSVMKKYVFRPFKGQKVYQRDILMGGSTTRKEPARRPSPRDFDPHHIARFCVTFIHVPSQPS